MFLREKFWQYCCEILHIDNAVAFDEPGLPNVSAK